MWLADCGEGGGTCREGSDDGKQCMNAVQCRFFFPFASLFDCPKDLGKLESLGSVECFFSTFLQLSEIEMAIGVKESVLVVLVT